MKSENLASLPAVAYDDANARAAEHVLEAVPLLDGEDAPLRDIALVDVRRNIPALTAALAQHLGSLSIEMQTLCDLLSTERPAS